ncbi:MAG TPA: hypothetical protein VNA25_16555, partial [Phycisphaerae bacterium]|nr:hypothetical protein [Phycisphaerae bacterium]
CYANSTYFCSKWTAFCPAGTAGDRRACSYYQKAIRIKPDEALAHMGLGRIHYSNCLRIEKEWDIFPEGRELAFAYEKDPDEPDSDSSNLVSLLSEADQRCANRKVAIKELERGASLTGDLEDKVGCLTMAAEMRCRLSNADGISAFRATIRLAPEHLPSHFHLGCLYAAAGKLEDALTELDFVKANSPELADKMTSEMKRLGVSCG